MPSLPADHVTVRCRYGGHSALAVFDTAAQAQNEQFIPALVYRTGPYAPNGIPFADGYADYLAMVNERDGGINGVKIITEECETGYDNDSGVECYERLKNKGPTGAAAFNPLSTGIAYALIERAPSDRIPIMSLGYGRSDSADGRVFPWVFPIPAPTGRRRIRWSTMLLCRKAAMTS